MLAGETGTHIRSKFVINVGRNCMDQHGLLLGSIDATKPCIRVLVVRLKPVAERRTQHAGRRTRRSALHHEMLSIEEIGGVSAVKRKRLESGVWPEYGGGPFPSVPEHSFDAECTATLRMGVYWSRIPTLEVKISPLRIRNFVPPRKHTL